MILNYHPELFTLFSSLDLILSPGLVLVRRGSRDDLVSEYRRLFGTGLFFLRHTGEFVVVKRELFLGF